MAPFFFGVLAVIVILLLLKIVTYKLRTRRLRQMANQFDGPPTKIILGNSLMLLGSLTDVFEKVHELLKSYHGKAFRFWILHKPFIVLSNPKDIQIAGRLLEKDNQTYKYLSEGIGDGMITAEPEKWKRTHPLVSPAFNATAISGIYLDIFNKQSLRLMEKLKQDVGMEKSFDVGPYILSLTVSSIYETAMGFEETTDESMLTTLEERTRRCDELVVKRTMSPWLHPRFIFKAYLFIKGCSNIFEECREIHKETILKKKQMFENAKTSGKAQEEERKSVIDILLKTGDFSDHELIEELMTILFAGSDTITATLSFALLMLAQHQDIQEKAYQELYDVFGNSDRLPDAADLSKLKFLEQCIKETLRKFSTIPYVLRQATSDIILSDGQIIPADATIYMSIYALHHSPQYYPDPETWNPNNFDPKAVENRPANTFIPFGTGPRICIGYKYAMMSMKAMLSTFIRNFQITSDQKETKLNVTFITKSANGYHIELNPRY